MGQQAAFLLIHVAPFFEHSVSCHPVQSFSGAYRKFADKLKKLRRELEAEAIYTVGVARITHPPMRSR
jgi:hypothetical protein